MKQTDNIKRLKSFGLFVNDKLIIAMAIDFLSQIIPDTITTRDNNIIYKLSLDKFIDKYIKSYCNRIQIKIVLNNCDNIENIELINYYKFIPLEGRNTIMRQQHIFQYVCMDMNYNEDGFFETSIPRITINGLFIEVDDIEIIQHIKIKINGSVFRSLDNILLNLIGEKINDHLMYIPFNPGQDMWDRSVNGAVHFSQIDCNIIQIKGYDAQNTIKIHVIGHNMLNNSTIPQFLFTHYNMYKHPALVHKLLVSKECLISLEEINVNSKYMECGTCEKAFLINPINEWLKSSTTCPHCREPWTDNIIYINACEQTHV